MYVSKKDFIIYFYIFAKLQLFSHTANLSI